jgi:hypothetical protein
MTIPLNVLLKFYVGSFWKKSMRVGDLFGPFKPISPSTQHHRQAVRIIHRLLRRAAFVGSNHAL